MVSDKGWESTFVILPCCFSHLIFSRTNTRSAPCQTFTPTLIDFYKKCAQPNGMEIIYVSSDNTREEFHAELEKMPWLAMDGDQKGAVLKHALATNLKAFNIPTLVLLNVKTGNFVTDLGRKDLLELVNNNKKSGDGDENKDTTAAAGQPTKEQEADYVTRGKALVETWKTMEPIAIGHNSTVLTNLQTGIDFFAANPLYLAVFVAILAFTSLIQRIIQNPLLGVAFWLIFKNYTKEPLSRNEPYAEQQSSGTDEDETEKKKQ